MALFAFFPAHDTTFDTLPFNNPRPTRVCRKVTARNIGELFISGCFRELRERNFRVFLQKLLEEGVVSKNWGLIVIHDVFKTALSRRVRDTIASQFGDGWLDEVRFRLSFATCFSTGFRVATTGGYFWCKRVREEWGHVKHLDKLQIADL